MNSFLPLCMSTFTYLAPRFAPDNKRFDLAVLVRWLLFWCSAFFFSACYFLRSVYYKTFIYSFLVYFIHLLIFSTIGIVIIEVLFSYSYGKFICLCASNKIVFQVKIIDACEFMLSLVGRCPGWKTVSVSFFLSLPQGRYLPLNLFGPLLRKKSTLASEICGNGCIIEILAVACCLLFYAHRMFLLSTPCVLRFPSIPPLHLLFILSLFRHHLLSLPKRWPLFLLVFCRWAVFWWTWWSGAIRIEGKWLSSQSLFITSKQTPYPSSHHSMHSHR